MAVPAAPSNVRVVRAHDGRHAVSWTRNNSSDPSQWQTLQRWSDVTNTYQTITAQLAPQVSTVEDRGTVSNRQYSYRVRVANSEGSSAWAYSVMFHTAPIYPTGVTGTPSGGQVRVSWLSNAPDSVSYEVRELVGGSVVATHTTGVNARQIWVTPADPNVIHQYSVRAVGTGPEDQSLYSVWRTSSEVVIYAPPNAPTGVAPHAVAVDPTGPVVLSWEHQSVDGSGQSGFTLQYGLEGSPVSGWTVVTQASTAKTYTIPAGTFSYGDRFQWQVRTRGVHPDLSSWSALAVVDAASTPVLTLTSPTANAVLGGASLTMVTNYEDPAGERITSRQVRLADGVTGVTLEGRTTTMDLPPSGTVAYKFGTFLENGEAYYALVRYQNASGIWSDWASVRVTVSYQAPRPANVTAVFDEVTGSTMVAYSHPNPLTGPGAPDHAEVWRRMPGHDWEIMGEDLGLSGAVVDPIPALRRITEYRVVTYTALDAVTTTVTGGFPDVRGWVYFNAGDGLGEVYRLRHGTQTATDRGASTALHPVAGRSAPVAIDGVQTSMSLSVDARVGEGTALDGSTVEELERMIHTPGVKAYRDPSGKRFFCSIRSFSERHEGMFQHVSIPVTEVDHVERLPGADS